MFSLLPVTLFPLTSSGPHRPLESVRQEPAGVGPKRWPCPRAGSRWPLLWRGCLGCVHQGLGAPAPPPSCPGPEESVWAWVSSSGIRSKMKVKREDCGPLRTDRQLTCQSCTKYGERKRAVYERGSKERSGSSSRPRVAV